MFSIRIKILISLVILTTAASVLSLAFTAWLFFEQLKTSTFNNLLASKELFVANLDSEARKIDLDANLLVSLTDFVKDIESQKSQSILKVAKKLMDEKLIQEFYSYDNSGNVISQEAKNIRLKEYNFFTIAEDSKLKEAFKNALKGIASNHINYTKNQIKVTTIHPVISKSQSVCGVIVLSNPINDEFLEKIKNLAKVDISIVLNNQINATTLQESDDKTSVIFFHKMNEASYWSFDKGFYMSIPIINSKPAYVIFSVSNANIRYTYTYIFGFIILLGTFIIIISVIVSGFVSSSITRGLKSLEKSAINLSQGNLDEKILTKGNDEVAILANSFDRMRQSIKKLVINLKALNLSYQRFVPFQFLKLLNKDDITKLELGDCSEAQITILFSDIRDFTTLSETMSAKECFEFINLYLQEVAPIVKKNGGFIDKFIGDAVMGIFPNNPNQAIKTAIEMEKCLDKINKKLGRSEDKKLNIGIGLHTGSAIVGVVGESQRLDATVIGDSVNLASRIESLTKNLGKRILVSKSTYDLLSNKDKKLLVSAGQHRVKGKSKPITVYEVIE